MKKLILLFIPLALLGLGCRQTEPPPEPQNDAEKIRQLPQQPAATYFEIHEGDAFSVDGLAFEINDIISLTADGCESEPSGCPDSVDLTVSIPQEKQTIKLVVLGGQAQNASSERVIYGHRVAVSRVTADSATMAVFVAENPIIPPTNR